VKYELLDHTADIQFRVYGADEGELVANAAYALFDQLADLSGVRASETDSVSGSGNDLEEALVDFLEELLYRFDVDGRIYGTFRTTEVTDTAVTAECRGEDFDAARHERRTGIKAVTFHNVNIERGPDGFSVVLTCDV
jgi:SHS2 domain-containing protein